MFNDCPKNIIILDISRNKLENFDLNILNKRTL